MGNKSDCQSKPRLQLLYRVGRAIAQAASRWLPRFDPRSGHVGFVVDKVALGQVFSEYFGFPCRSSFHQLLHDHHHLSSGAGTIGQQWPTYQVDPVSPHPQKRKKKLLL
jgi:Zn-dependent M28 family amino/carboxypeptidase